MPDWEEAEPGEGGGERGRGIVLDEGKGSAQDGEERGFEFRR